MPYVCSVELFQTYLLKVHLRYIDSSVAFQKDDLSPLGWRCMMAYTLFFLPPLCVFVIYSEGLSGKMTAAMQSPWPLATGALVNGIDYGRLLRQRAPKRMEMSFLT